jgi:hypothetical protein
VAETENDQNPQSCSDYENEFSIAKLETDEPIEKLAFPDDNEEIT